MSDLEDSVVPDILTNNIHGSSKEIPSLLHLLRKCHTLDKRSAIMDKCVWQIIDTFITDTGISILVDPTPYAITTYNHTQSLIPVILVADTVMFDDFASARSLDPAPPALVRGQPTEIFFRAFLLRLLELAGIRVPIRSSAGTLRVLYNYRPIEMQSLTKMSLLPFHLMQELDAFITTEIDPMALALISAIGLPSIHGLPPAELLWSIAASRDKHSITIHRHFKFDNSQIIQYSVTNPRDVLVSYIKERIQ